jgi:hypothetical protein
MDYSTSRKIYDLKITRISNAQLESTKYSHASGHKNK